MEKDTTTQQSPQQAMPEGEGATTMSAPAFQLQASSDAPVQRAVSPDYERIKSLLSTSFLSGNWAVTDGDVTEVLTILNHLSDEDLVDTVNQLKSDNLLDTLRSNLTDPESQARFSHQTLFFKVLERINEADSQGAVASYPAEARPRVSLGTDFESYLTTLGQLEASARAEGYSTIDVITAMRRIYYNTGPSEEYAGTTVGGGAWGILIPDASADIPTAWQTPENQAILEAMKQNQVISIAGQSVDIGHLFAGLDAVNHPTDINIAFGAAVSMRSNIEATTWGGDLGSVIGEYVLNAGDGQSMSEFTNTRNDTILNQYFDDNFSAADMAGDIDVYNIQIDSSISVTENLRRYYQDRQGRAASQRYTNFATQVGYLQNGAFNEAFKTQVVNESFEAAMAYVAGKGRRDQVALVRSDQGPPLVGDNHWELYYNVANWCADLFLERIRAGVEAER
jgi:hypothetical protein